MRIVARQLMLKNLNELASTTVDGTTYMGQLESVTSSLLGYEVVIGGHVLKLDAGHPLEIRRTAISESLQLANELQDDLLDSLGAEDAVA